jgi:hypothetical protein
LASQAHKQNRALLNLTTRKPDTITPVPATVAPKSKTVSVGRVVIAGSITKKSAVRADDSRRYYPWHALTHSETREIIFHAWFCRAALDTAEKRQRAGDKFALLSLPAYCRPDVAVREKFTNYFNNTKPKREEQR